MDWQYFKDVIKVRFFALLLIALGIGPMFINGDMTIAIFLVPAGLALLFIRVDRPKDEENYK